MADTTYKYQTYKGNFYVITTSQDTTITDSKSGNEIAALPANCQGIIFAVGKEITASAPIKINIVK